MARSLDQVVAALHRLDPASADALSTVRMALKLKTGFVTAAAAKAIQTHAMRDAIPELVDAFDALAGPKRDPGCRGRFAIASALYALDHWAPEVFERGLTLVEIEGIFPHHDDAAAGVRGACAQAHVHFLRSDALDVCAELLADEWLGARLGAAHGLGASGRIDATATLRYKLSLGPDDSEVMGACFDALFALRRDPAIAFCTALLHKTDARAPAAALALGSQRATEATEDLIAWCARTSEEERQEAGYLALALLRSDAANTALGDAISTGSASDARAAAAALATFKHEPAIRDLLLGAASAVKDKKLRAELQALV